MKYPWCILLMFTVCVCMWMDVILTCTTALFKLINTDHVCAIEMLMLLIYGLLLTNE